MIEARAEELINLALDGTLSAPERRELDQLLSASPEAREYQAALQSLDGRLKAMPAQPGPAGLHDDIMATVSRTAAVNDSSPATSNVTFLQAPLWGAAMRYGLAASVGLAFAVVVYETRELTGTVGVEQMTGTMAPGRARQDTPYAFAIAETGLSSQVSMTGNPEKLVLDVTIDSAEPIDLIINLADDWRFDDLALALSTPDKFAVTGNKIQLRGHGQQRYAVLLLPAGKTAPTKQATITFDYMRNGTLVQQRVLSARAL